MCGIGNGERELELAIREGVLWLVGVKSYINKPRLHCSSENNSGCKAVHAKDKTRERVENLKSWKVLAPSLTTRLANENTLFLSKQENRKLKRGKILLKTQESLKLSKTRIKTRKKKTFTPATEKKKNEVSWEFVWKWNEGTTRWRRWYKKLGIKKRDEGGKNIWEKLPTLIFLLRAPSSVMRKIFTSKKLYDSKLCRNCRYSLLVLSGRALIFWWRENNVKLKLSRVSNRILSSALKLYTRWLSHRRKSQSNSWSESFNVGTRRCSRLWDVHHLTLFPPLSRISPVATRANVYKKIYFH